MTRLNIDIDSIKQGPVGLQDGAADLFLFLYITEKMKKNLTLLKNVLLNVFQGFLLVTVSLEIFARHLFHDFSISEILASS